MQQVPKAWDCGDDSEGPSPPLSGGRDHPGLHSDLRIPSADNEETLIDFCSEL